MPTNKRHVPMAQRSHAGALPATPEISEVMQEETAPDRFAVLVEHNGPIATRALPTRAGAPSTAIVPADGDQVLGRDLKRARVTLIATDNPFFYSSRSQSNWSTASAAIWPINVPLVLLHGDAIHAACATSGQTSTISIIPENMDGI
jgi:hypothetical protein